MEGKPRLDKSNRSVLENSQYLYSENENKERDEDFQNYQQELQNYENKYKNNNNSNKNKNLYHFKYSGKSEGLEKSQNNITVDNMSTFTFGARGQNLSSSNRFDSNNSLVKSQNINQEALSFENSNIFNSSHLDLTNSISIKKENNLLTKCPYVAFSNNYGDNSCYVNVVLQLLFNITDLNNIFKDLYKIDEIQKQNPKEKLNSTNKENGNPDNSSNISTGKNLAQSNNFTTPDINELFIEIGDILSNYELYLNTDNTVQQVTILDTKKMRTSLEKMSNGLFPLNYVADPVELFIFILDNLNINYQREIHSNFYIELIDKVVCKKRCPNTTKTQYDKDNFLYHIYVEEIINYINDNAIKFRNSKGDLFNLSYSLYLEQNVECEKCTLLMDKFLLCLNSPKYLLINCVWKNAVPEVKEIVKFLFLLSLEDDLNNLFVCQNTTKTKNTKYHLLGMILYSYTLCHYTVLIFNKKERIYTLYNDDTVKEFKTLYDAFPEMLINNVNLYDNDRGYFYPVMLIYTNDVLYNRNDINKNSLDERQYVSLLDKIEKNQQQFIQKHTLTEEQKQKNLEELIAKQKEYDQKMAVKNSKSNNNLKNIDMNEDTQGGNNLGQNDNNEQNWMNYNFADDNRRKNKNNIIKNNNEDIKMTNEDYYKVYGNDLLKGQNRMQEYKNYYNELGNLNIDELVNNKNNNKRGNNNQNEFLRSIHEQSNSNIKTNLEASQQIKLNNNNFFNNDYDENNRLAQSQVIPSTKYFADLNKNNNYLNKSNNIQSKNNTQIINNSNQRKNEAKLTSSQQIDINKVNYLYQQNDLKNKKDLSHTYNNIDNNYNLPNLAKSQIINIEKSKNQAATTINNNKSNILNNQLNAGTFISTNKRLTLGNNQTKIETNSINNTKNVINNQSNSIGNINNNRVNLAKSQNNISIGNNYGSSYNYNNNLGTNINNNRTNLAQSQYIGGNNRRTNLGYSSNNIESNKEKNLAHSQYNINRRNNQK